MNEQIKTMMPFDFLAMVLKLLSQGIFIQIYKFSLQHQLKAPFRQIFPTATFYIM